MAVWLGMSASADSIASIDGGGIQELASTTDLSAERPTVENMTQSERLSESKTKSTVKDWENLGRLYKNDDNPVVQEWWFLGRYHGQNHWSDGNQGRDEGWENRRFRLGSQARFFEKLTAHAQMVSGSDFEPFYNGFTELWTQWAFDDALVFSVGQQKHRFTHDRNVSSRYMNTLERSLLTNMFALDYTPAVTLSGKSDQFSYYTGVFSNATGPDMSKSLTEFDSGYSLLASGTWNLGEALKTDTAHVILGYLYSQANERATLLNRFNHGISVALVLTKDACSFISEGLMGLGNERGDGYGLNLQPGYFITKDLQLSTRYQIAISDGNSGLTAQNRYERPAGLTTGDLYQAVYVGFNYHVVGHNLKIMNGVEYSDLSGQHLATAMVAVRIFWGPNASGPFPIAKTLKPN